ncbi:Putative hemolysin III-like membrane protein [Caenispirillum salinarum AK4]|uniref:Putative hemolysin III-like membrane protein n=1 Tax=Caenispirillum salinarum AK4 TaxID=1238182 RepID=K9H1E5_9PROT|nr:hemolysin III family protein [Caenispirillum salinarum]EKV31387.1 Putative hemolysin III-like membrane protein [Caenispirillum salinarum AK4]
MTAPGQQWLRDHLQPPTAAGWADLFPSYSRAERIADAVVHVLGITAGIIASAWLLAVAAFQAGGIELASLAVYSLGLVGMLTASALYNLWPPGRVKEILQRCDHAMIYVMIGGSYTPFVVNVLDGGLGMVLAGIVWTGVTAGIVLKVGFPRRMERLGLALYLALGWCIVVAIEPLAGALTPLGLTLLVLGGVLYTVGTGLHLLERLPFHNVGWHVMVLAAAGCHFAAVVVEVIPGSAVAG